MELFARVVAGFRGELRISPTKMKLFAKIVENEKPFTIFPKTSVLDAWQGSGYASELPSKVKDVSFLTQVHNFEFFNVTLRSQTLGNITDTLN